MTKNNNNLIFELVVMHGYQKQVNDALAENEALGTLLDTCFGRHPKNAMFAEFDRRDRSRIYSEIGNKMSKNGIEKLPQLAKGIKECAFAVVEADVAMQKKIHLDCVNMDIVVPVTCSQVTLNLQEAA